MLNFFDTETTGIVDFRAPLTAPHQPRIVQLGAQLHDANRRVVAEMNLLVKPDGWTIPPEATAIHGITTEMCDRFGFPIKTVLGLFIRMARKSDLQIAFNFDYDNALVQGELVRLEAADDLAFWLQAKSFCAMKAATPVLKIPGGRGGEYRWPKLSVAYRHFTGSELEGAHDAMADVRGCAAVFYALKQAEAPSSSGVAEESFE